jgi:hypothetical protein
MTPTGKGESFGESVPPFIRDTLRTMKFGRRAGEWDLKLPEPDQESSRGHVRTFLECFTWASVQRLSPDTLLIDSPHTSMHDRGFEAELALRMHWIGPDKEMGESDLPGAGALLYDRGSGIIVFTVWPNLFTDLIELYSEGEYGFSATRIPWVPAAEHNRRRLAQSLACWQRAARGKIVSAESELVDGVLIGGFSDTAMPS